MTEAQAKGPSTGAGSTLNAAGTAIELLDTDAAGVVTTSITWNSFGEATQRQTGNVVDTTDYDQAGRAWRTTSGGTSTVLLYDEQGHVTAQLGSAGSVDTGGLGVDLGDATIASAQDANALSADVLRRIDFNLDLLGRQLEQILPQRVYATSSMGPGVIVGLRPSVKQTFDRWGNVVAQTDVNNASRHTEFTYNRFNQVTHKVQPNGSGVTEAGNGTSPETWIFYDALGRQVAVRDADGNLNGQTWDAGGHLVQERHADGGVVTHGYNAFGEQVSLLDAEHHLTTYGYDHMGRNTSVTHYGVDIFEPGFQNGDWLEWLIQQPEHQITTVSTYDAAGRKTSQTAGGGLGRIEYRYDARGNVVRTRDAVGDTTYAAFDALGHQVAQVDGNGKLATWTYNAGNQLEHRTDIGGATYTYEYDAANQLVMMGNDRLPDPTKGITGAQYMFYHYDAAGQLVGIVDASSRFMGPVQPEMMATTTYRYNLAGQRVFEQMTKAGVTYQQQEIGYDNLGRMVQVKDHVGHLQVDFDYLCPCQPPIA